jgi:SET domain-containing protein
VLTVKTTIGPSAIHGIGLFAAEPIARGAMVWRFSHGFDQVFLHSVVERYGGNIQLAVERYAYVQGDVFILCADDARFFNHSDEPNCSAGEESKALRDIQIGEELTEDYKLFAVEHWTAIQESRNA